MSNLNKNDQDTFEGLLELVQNTTGKPKEESLAILQKFSTEIQKKTIKKFGNFI